MTVELLSILRAYPVRDQTSMAINHINDSFKVGVQFLQSLNHLHRYAYVRQAHAREVRMSRAQTLPPTPHTATLNSRMPSHRPEAGFPVG